MMTGGVFFPIKQGILSVQGRERIKRSRGGSRLGAHTNPNQTPKRCVCLTVDITEGMFVVIRRVDQASPDTRRAQTRGDVSV